jgi:hypothetical protein
MPRETEPISKKESFTGVKPNGLNVAKVITEVAQKSWSEVRSSRRTPTTNAIAKDSNKHWTNSFHLLARADGKYELGEVRRSGAAIYYFSSTRY